MSTQIKQQVVVVVVIVITTIIITIESNESIDDMIYI